MIEALYLPYLILLLLVPLLVLWRWGLIAAVVATVLELSLIALIFWLLDAYRLFPSVDIEAPPAQSPMEQIKRTQATGALLLLIWGAAPMIAALAGGALAILIAGLRVLWRYFRRRTVQ